MVRGKDRFENASSAEGCREVAADGEGDRVGGSGRLCATFGRKVLSEG